MTKLKNVPIRKNSIDFYFFGTITIFFKINCSNISKHLTFPTDVVKKGRQITCVDFLESGDLVAGDTDGVISTYSVSNEGEYYMSHEFDAHKGGAVNCLLMLNENFIVSGGDRDRVRTQYWMGYRFESNINLKNYIYIFIFAS